MHAWGNANGLKEFPHTFVASLFGFWGIIPLIWLGRRQAKMQTAIPSDMVED
jgi:hypothetical protein